MDVNTLESQQSAQPVDMDDFEAGFNDGMEPDANADNAEVTVPVESLDTFEAPEQEQHEAPAQGMPEQTEAAPAAPVVPEQVQPVAPVIQVAQVAISSEIADEYAELERLSPMAAALAREDSPEGAAIRDRLERVGADSAFDRAEVLLDRRERAAQANHAQQQALEAHNRNFKQVLHTEHPEIFAPDRTPEQNQRLMADVRTWIEGKPYAEARGLMEIYEGGRDPRQVAALLTRFKQEAGTPSASGTTGATGVAKKTTVDHTAALAVAGRGAPIVPKTVGGKDDFETGWNL